MHEFEKAAAVEEAKRQVSRKGFLIGAAGILGGGALLAVPGMAKAHSPADDIDQEILNYALTLEHLEATFYEVGMRRFGSQLPPRQFRNLTRIMNHERRHVTLFTNVIEGAFGAGQAVPRLDYNFNETAFTNVNRFLTVARLLEDTGVSAYDGAIAHITAAGYLTVGAQIATVEARHASYLRNIKDESPFPEAVDEAVPPRDIATTVRDTFVTSDPDASPYGPYESFNAFLALLPDTLQPAETMAAGTASSNVDGQDLMEEAEAE